MSNDPMHKFLSRLKQEISGCTTAQVVWENERCAALKRPYIRMRATGFSIYGQDQIRYIDNGTGEKLGREICALRDFSLDLQSFALKKPCVISEAVQILENLWICLRGEKSEQLSDIDAALISRTSIAELNSDEGLARAQTSFQMRGALGYTLCSVPYIEQVKIQNAVIRDEVGAASFDEEIVAP